MGGKGSKRRAIVESKSVRNTFLLKRRPFKDTIYGPRAGLAYIIWVFLKIFFFEAKEEGELDFSVVTIMLIITAHILSYIWCNWDANVARVIQYRKARDCEDASVILVIPNEGYGKPSFCEIENKDSEDEIYIMYRKRKYVYNRGLKVFEKIKYPDSISFSKKELLRYDGIQSTKDFNKTESLSKLYGDNAYKITPPTFFDLLLEHVLSPIFIFQVFSIMMWILDGMVGYSISVISALVMFESIVVFQRLKTIQEFSSMSPEPYDMHVFRDNKWFKIRMDKLLPWDLVSISQNEVGRALTADMILINGSCVVDEAVMTGESTPQIREGIELGDQLNSVPLRENPLSILYGGTTLLQVIQPQTKAENVPPENGIKALVLRTGFSTKQGKLVKKIICNDEKVTVANSESFSFIIFLLFFAVISAVYVWIEGIKDENRKKGSILLDCVLVVISVVPPDLPTEISLAVNNSIAALAKNFIFCMEPFRVPYAGRIDVACFDKTGTLTELRLSVEGISVNGSSTLSDPTIIPELQKKILGTAHSIIMIDNKSVGDSMEQTMVDSVGWEVRDSNIVCPKDEPPEKSGHLILRRYQFSSAMKCMSTISIEMKDLLSVNPPKAKSKNVTLWASCKGAPDKLLSLISDPPSGYSDLYKKWVKNGRRVLAFAYKKIEISTDDIAGSVLNLKRLDVESNLTLAGFLVFICPLKKDAKQSIAEILYSMHRVIMITGDNIFTACHVAKELNIVNEGALIADIWDGKTPSLVNVDQNISLPINPEETVINKEIGKSCICMSGKALTHLYNTPWMKTYCPRIWVYAHIFPNQKDDIIKMLRRKGYTTMMCGDGTNDVGALRSAHVGVAILNGDAEKLKKIRDLDADLKQIRAIEKQQAMRESIGLGPLASKLKEQLQELKKKSGIRDEESLLKLEQNARENLANSGDKLSPNALMKELIDNLGQEDNQTIKPGDASIAASFTSKVSSVNNMVVILCQGRATLVAILQTYKTLALTCIVSSYSILFLSLSGVKQSDFQSTIAAILSSSCFFGISKSKTLEKLSKQRPQSKAFSPYVLSSIIGQAAVHIGSIMYLRIKSIEHSEEDLSELNSEKEFYPNILNTSVYLGSLVIQMATFLINYQGHPFRKGITENKPLLYSVVFVTIFSFLCISGIVPSLNEALQLVPFTDEYRKIVWSVIFFDITSAWAIERICLYFLSDAKYKKELFPELEN